MSIYVRAIDVMSNHTAADLRGVLSDLITAPGVVDLAGDHFLVDEAAVPDMSVDVAEGIAYVLNSSWTEFSSDQRLWDVLLDAAESVVISSNASGSTRIDLICLKIDTGVTPDANASNVATLVSVEGTPGGGAPALPNDHLLLAEVEVIDGATTIPDAKIADGRVQAVIKTEIINLIDEDDMDTNSAIRPPSQQSLKTYVDSGTKTLTNTRITKRVTTITSSATPTVNTDNADVVTITALAVAITSMTTNLSGTPTNFQSLIFRILDNGTGRALTFGASFQAMGVDLPTTTTANKVLTVGFLYDSVDSKWGAVAVSDEG